MSRLRFLWIACFFFCSFMGFGQLLSSTDKPVVLKTSTGDIHGKMLLPSSGRAVPIVLLIAGSGPTDMDGNTPASKLNNNSLKFLAETLSRHNIASVRYDKRGIASSLSAGKVEKDLRFEDYVNDARGWINLLADDNRFSSIIVAGHSEGALVGMVACLGNSKVKAFISIAGAGRPADQIIEEQVSARSKELLELVRPINKKLKSGKTENNVPQALYVLFRPSVQPYLISWYAFDPCKIIAGLKIPALIVQGSTDVQVSEKDAEALKKAYPSARYVLIEGMNHVMKLCRTKDLYQQAASYADPKAPLAPEFVNKVVSFIDTVK